MEVEVHPARRVGADPQPGDASGEAVGGRVGVTGTDREQHAEAGADLAGYPHGELRALPPVIVGGRVGLLTPRFHQDAGVAHTLDDRPHPACSRRSTPRRIRIASASASKKSAASQRMPSTRKLQPRRSGSPASGAPHQDRLEGAAVLQRSPLQLDPAQLGDRVVGVAQLDREVEALGEVPEDEEHRQRVGLIAEDPDKGRRRERISGRFLARAGRLLGGEEELGAEARGPAIPQPGVAVAPIAPAHQLSETILGRIPTSWVKAANADMDHPAHGRIVGVEVGAAAPYRGRVAMPSMTRSTQRTSRASSRGSPVISMRTYMGPISVSRASTGSTLARSSPRALARSNRAAPLRNRWAQYPPRAASYSGRSRRRASRTTSSPRGVRRNAAIPRTTARRSPRRDPVSGAGISASVPLRTASSARLDLPPQRR